MKPILFFLSISLLVAGCGTSAYTGRSSEEVNTGYDVQTRDGLTSSVSRVDIQENSRMYSNIYEMIIGRCPGVQVQGDRIIIRGASTALGSSDPLFVVNGTIVPNLDTINPNDVKTIDVLKDASATSLYGMQGANGVIVITTK